MKYIKISSFIAIAIILFIYYQANSNNNNSVFEDKLSIFIFVKSHKNIDNILFDLETQIESFDEYVHNVYHVKNNNFIIQNKLKLNIHKEYIDYRKLFNSSDISDFNIIMGQLIEEYFLNNNIYLYKTKRYFLRDFLIRLYHYINFEINIFNQNNNILQDVTNLEDFIVGIQELHDYQRKYSILRIEFTNLESKKNYHKSGVDSIFQSILQYNSNTFNSELFLYDPNNLDDLKMVYLKVYLNIFYRVYSLSIVLRIRTISRTSKKSSLFTSPA